VKHDAVDERHEFSATLRASDPDAPTLCGDWTAALLTAHLVQRERSLREGLGRLPVPAFQRRAEQGLVHLVSTRSYPELVDRFEAGPPPYSPWSVGPLREAVNLLEYAIHHEDVRRVDPHAEPRAIPVARQRALWQKLRHSAPFLMRRVGVPVRLVAAPFGEARVRPRAEGAPVIVTGDPLELALVAFGRQRVARVDYDGPPDAVAALREARIAV
jgi:uncharacterized protein (TIGR03085 family)